MRHPKEGWQCARSEEGVGIQFAQEEVDGQIDQGVWRGREQDSFHNGKETEEIKVRQGKRGKDVRRTWSRYNVLWHI